MCEGLAGRLDAEELISGHILVGLGEDPALVFPAVLPALTHFTLVQPDRLKGFQTQLAFVLEALDGAAVFLAEKVQGVAIEDVIPGLGFLDGDLLQAGVLDGGLEFPHPLAVDEGVGDGLADGVCHRCVWITYPPSGIPPLLSNCYFRLTLSTW